MLGRVHKLTIALSVLFAFGTAVVLAVSHLVPKTRPHQMWADSSTRVGAGLSPGAVEVWCVRAVGTTLGRGISNYGSMFSRHAYFDLTRDVCNVGVVGASMAVTEYLNYNTVLLPAGVQNFPYTTLCRETYLRLPLILLLVLFCVYPAMCFLIRGRQRYRRRKKGLCIKCAYDLTGNASGICPECGETL